MSIGPLSGWCRSSQPLPRVGSLTKQIDRAIKIFLIPLSHLVFSANYVRQRFLPPEPVIVIPSPEEVSTSLVQVDTLQREKEAVPAKKRRIDYPPLISNYYPPLFTYPGVIDVVNYYRLLPITTLFSVIIC